MRTKKGVITSAKMTGTVTVTVHRYAVHPIYKKRFRKSKKFLADIGEHKDLIEGDMVEISECKPLSKNKCFVVSDVITRAPRVSELQEEKDIEETVHRKKEKPVQEEAASEEPAADEAPEAETTEEATEEDSTQETA